MRCPSEERRGPVGEETHDFFFWAPAIRAGPGGVKFQARAPSLEAGPSGMARPNDISMRRWRSVAGAVRVARSLPGCRPGRNPLPGGAPVAELTAGVLGGADTLELAEQLLGVRAATLLQQNADLPCAETPDFVTQFL